MRTHGRGELFGCSEQVNRAILVCDHEGQSDRRARYILAADVQQPRNRIERGNHHGIGALFGQPLRHVGAFVGMGPAGERGVMHFQRRQARRRAVGPRRIDRVPCHRHQFGATRLELPSGLLGPGAGVKPRIIADALAGLRLFPQPLRGAGLRHVFIGKQIRRHLLAHLHRVTAIGEHRGLIRHHNRAAGAAAKTADPRQPLGIFADIFAHMLIGERHHKTGKVLGGKFGAQGCKAAGNGGHGQSSLYQCPLR